MKFHDVFHVSLLKKYVKDVYHVVDWYELQVELNGIIPSRASVYVAEKSAHAPELSK